jgi:hypothetical protein
MASWGLLRGWVFSAWTTPATWAVDQLVTAGDLNTELRDNLNALKTPPSAHYECDESSDITTNSTSWVDVDSTLELTITTSGGDVMIGFTGTVDVGNSQTRVYFDVYESEADARLGGDDGICMLKHASVSAIVYFYPVSFVYLATGLSAGEHTFTLQWKVNANSATLYAGAGTSGYDVHPQFWVREVS